MSLKQRRKIAEIATNDTKTGLNCDSDIEEPKYNSEILTATWRPPQYVKWQVLKDKGHMLSPPLPWEGLINPHCHTNGATSHQSPSNLQPSTPGLQLLSVPALWGPFLTILFYIHTPHLHPHPYPHASFWFSELVAWYFRRAGSILGEKISEKNFLTKMLISKGQNTEKKFLKD